MPLPLRPEPTDAIAMVRMLLPPLTPATEKACQTKWREVGISCSPSATKRIYNAWNAFDFELWSGVCREVAGCISSKRAHDWLVYRG